MIVILGSAAGLSCAFYAYVLIMFAKERYTEMVKRRHNPLAVTAC
jgi:hypothetical protein